MDAAYPDAAAAAADEYMLDEEGREDVDYYTKRELTSAVPDMNVAEVRRGLQQMRNMWKRHSPGEPFRLSSRIFNGRTIARFSYDLCLTQTIRRHSKSNASKRSKTSGAGAADANPDTTAPERARQPSEGVGVEGGVVESNVPCAGMPVRAEITPKGAANREEGHGPVGIRSRKRKSAKPSPGSKDEPLAKRTRIV